MPARGFTLLEVMISLAILAVALVALSGLNGGAVAMQAYARRATEAALLLRAKMNDLEEELQKEGFSDFDDEKHGAFEDEGAPDYSWRAEILKPDVQLDPAQLLGLFGMDTQSGAAGLASALGRRAGGAQGSAGTGGPPGLLSALAAPGGPMAGAVTTLLQGQARGFLETLKKSVREVRLTVSWRDGSEERSISASQQLVILPQSVGKAGQPAPAPAQPQPGQSPIPGAPLLPLPFQQRLQPYDATGGVNR